MMYAVGRQLVRFLLAQFFYRITLKGDPDQYPGPLLVVCNHPNHMIDPFLLSRSFRRPLYFLAKSTLFANSFVSAFLKACHLIPVYRRQDAASEMWRNAQTFAEASGLLNGGRAIAVFPEGTSRGERTVLPLRTGAARIAFQADSESTGKLPLQILPVGLTYGDLWTFRSSVTIEVGQPRSIAEWRDQYAADPEQAVDALTTALESDLRALAADIPDATHVALVEKISRVFADAGIGDDHSRLQTIARNVEKVAPGVSAERAEIERRIDLYLRLSETLLPHRGSGLDAPVDRIGVVLSAPFVVLGVLLCWIPYRLTGKLAGWFATEPVYLASSKLIFGTIIFSIWFGFVAVLLLAKFSSAAALVLFAIALLSGWGVNKYQYLVRLWLLGRGRPLQLLRDMRDEIVRQLQGLRVV